MPGLVPGIHVFVDVEIRKTWMAGTSPDMTEIEDRANEWSISPAKPSLPAS